MKCTIKFPAAYFMRVPNVGKVYWETIVPVDDKGFVTKSAPKDVVYAFAQVLDRYGIKYELKGDA